MYLSQEKEVKNWGNNLEKWLMNRENFKIPNPLHTNIEQNEFINEFDWSTSLLGDPHTWSHQLISSVNLCLNSKAPMMVMWGKEMIQIYNEAYGKIIGIKHPHAFAAKGREVWKEVWDEIGPLLEEVLTTGRPVLVENQLFTLNRKGYTEECYFTFSYTPIYTGPEQISGIFVSVNETTHLILNKQHLRKLRNQQITNLFNQTPVALCLLTGPNFIIEVANKKMLELWEKTFDKVSNKPLLEVITKMPYHKYEYFLNTVYTTGEPAVFTEIPIHLLQKGKLETLFVKFVYEALREDDGTISGIMMLVDEITEQVNARKRIEENEERLRMAVQTTKLGTWDFNPITGELNWSEECKKIYAFPSEIKIDFKLFSEHIYHADKLFVEREIQQAMNPKGNGMYNITYRITRFDKSIRWIKSQGKVYFNAQSQAERFIGTVLDITDQRVFEENLRLSELRSRLAIEAAGIGTFDWDIPNATFQYSERLAHIFGYTDINGLTQDSFSSRIHPEDQEMRAEAHRTAFQTGALFYEARIVWPDNTIRWVRLNGTVLYDEKNNPLQMYGTTLDITDQKLQAEKLEELVIQRTLMLNKKNVELKNSEERYHKMVEEVQDYAILLLNKEGKIENWNVGAQKIKGYSTAEIVGKHFQIFYTEEDRKINLPQTLLKEAAKNGKAVHEGWRIRKDGSKFWGSIVLTALHGEGNEIIGFSKVTRDLTERKAAEDKMILYTAELESQNKELEQFAYVASHDLQEPLRKIQTFSDIIERNLNDTDTVKKYFDKINASSERMSELIKSVLNYSRVPKGASQMADVDLNLILANVKSDFELLLEEKKAYLKNETLPTVKGIPLQLNQLFSNLLGNALKFTAKPPLITIVSKVVEREEVINKPDFLKETQYTEIAFEDNGIGFEQQYEKQIFAMFQRLHGRQHYAGTGIGLALCKKIVENHQGYITAKSELGKGATFYVYFPIFK